MRSQSRTTLCSRCSRAVEAWQWASCAIGARREAGGKAPLAKADWTKKSSVRQVLQNGGAVDIGSNSRAGDRPRDVADRIARNLFPFAGEPCSRRGDLTSDFELVAVARTTKGLIERRAVPFSLKEKTEI